MISFASRRWLGWTLLILLSGLLSAAYVVYGPLLARPAYISGWLLFLLMLILAAYNARKKLPFLPLGTSEGWLQFHVYAGLLTVVLFGLHIGLKVPTGWFEQTLAWLYALVTLSGVAGLILSRRMPQRLTTRGGEVIFERIPTIRRALRDEAETLALKAIPEAHSATIADFYVQHLRDFFAGPRNFSLHLMELRGPLNQLLNKITDLNRYLNEQERKTLDQIAALVRQKDGLDYHFALQTMLKGWLFVHIPLTYSLLLFSIVHIILVFAFSGPAP